MEYALALGEEKTYEKSNYWTAERYWHTVGNRNWVFLTKDKQLKL